jgi:ABC-type branched-subunit amino acid transport system ATPase component/ABC-type branched-subunit amino acid transport system permease subunit
MSVAAAPVAASVSPGGAGPEVPRAPRTREELEAALRELCWSSPWRRGASLVAGFLAAWAVAAAFLPNGLPFGVVLYGLVLGGLTSLTAVGLVVLYRSSRIINFAQADIGGLAATVAVVMVAGEHLPYFAALPVGLAVALATGALIDLTVIRTLFNAPRLIVTVATIGLAQVLGAAELGIPTIFTKLRPLTTFRTPFRFSFGVGPITFTGDYVVAMVVVPLVLLGLAFFFNRTGYGIAIRGAADSNDRALLLGIPVRRLSTITWVLAAGLSGVASMLSGPILGPQLGVLAGPTALLTPLAAAVLGRMESLVVAFVASLVIQVFEQAVFWSYPRSSTVDLGLAVLVLVGLLFQRRRLTRTDTGGLGGYVALREVRPIPTIMRRLPEVRVGRALGYLAIAAAAVLVPLGLSDAKRTLLAYIAIYGIIAVSLVVLTGWAGQISLGQFAFAGLGAGVTASMFVHLHADLFVCLGASALMGALAAIVIGIPALRIPGLFLAVATMAFAVPVSTYFLNSAYFPSFTPPSLLRPAVLQRFDLNSAGTFYYFCLAILAICVLVAWNYRRSRAGRVAVAVRDNEQGASSFSVSPIRAKLTAFALAGALAGVAGGLYVIGLRGIGFSGFNPETSIEVFTMVVVGGLGSLAGGLIGAIYVQGAQYFLHGAAQLLATGGGILLVVQLFPSGLADVVYRGRDALLRALARRRGLSVPSLAERAAFATATGLPGRTEGDVGTAWGDGDGSRPGAAPGVLDTAELPAAAVLPAGPAPPAAAGRSADRAASRPALTVPAAGGRRDGPARDGPPLLSVSGLDASYGQVQVLFGVELEVAEGEVVALLGTNGAGKSTVLRVVSGLLKARHGEVRFEGRDITKLHPVERVEAGIVMVPGGRGVFPSLTVGENLRLAGWLSRKDPGFLAQATARVFELFPTLRERLDTKAAALSGGEQQMLTLGQALLCRPKLLMIDELSLGLAPTVVAEMLEVVRALAAAGITVVVVEQSVNVATSLAQRAVFMERGQVRYTGPTAELADRPDLVRSVFLGGARTRPRTPPGGDAAAGAPRSAGRGGDGPPVRSAVGDGAGPDGAVEAEPIFSVLDVTKRYGGVAALEGVSLEVREGEILGIIGANGAGKTTLFDVCSGFLAPDHGRVVLGGVDVTGLGAAERAELGLGRVFQDAKLFPSLTVAETIAVAAERHVEVRDPLLCALRPGSVAESEAEVARLVDRLIEEMGLGRYRDAFVSELSTGTRRVVELACARAHDPAVLLLDEPSSGIAQRESEALGELLVELRRETGGTFVVIEHDVPLIASIADRLVCFHLGRVLSEGPPDAVLADPAVAAAYLGSDEAAIARSGSLPRRAGPRPTRPQRAARTRAAPGQASGSGRAVRQASGSGRSTRSAAGRGKAQTAATRYEGGAPTTSTGAPTRLTPARAGSSRASAAATTRRPSRKVATTGAAVTTPEPS